MNQIERTNKTAYVWQISSSFPSFNTHKKIHIEIGKNVPSIKPKYWRWGRWKEGVPKMPENSYLEMNDMNASKDKVCAFVETIIHRTNCTRICETLGEKTNTLIPRLLPDMQKCINISLWSPPTFSHCGVKLCVSGRGQGCNITLLIF